MRKFVLFISVLSLALSCFGQALFHERRIYLFDVTKSMIGQGEIQTPNIFDQVKNSLLDAIDEIEDPNTEVIIIPFTNTPHKAIIGTIAQRDSLKAALTPLSVKPGDTNIVGAWKVGLSYLDSTKVNYFFLLTDGLQNCGETKESLFSTLGEWKSICKGKYFFSFYVMLTDNAVEQKIRTIATETPQMWSIQSLNIRAALIRTSLTQKSNIFENKTIGVRFVSNNSKMFMSDLGVKFSIPSNGFYEVTNTRQDSVNPNVYEFDIVEKTDKLNIPTDFSTNLHIEYNRVKYPLVFFTPEDIDMHIINRGVRRMTVKIL